MLRVGLHVAIVEHFPEVLHRSRLLIPVVTTDPVVDGHDERRDVQLTLGDLA